MRVPYQRQRPQNFRVPLAKNAKIDPSENPWFWNPGRLGVKFAPKQFMDKIKDLDPDGLIQVTWSPNKERWLVWAKTHKVNNPICQGWSLLFIAEWQGQYCPLDERVLATLYERSGRRWGNLHEYWLKVEQAEAYGKEQRAASRADDVKYAAGEYYDYTKIKNYGSGSKFTEHHA